MRRAQQQVVVALVALVLASVDDAAGFALSSSRGRAGERTVVSMNKGCVLYYPPPVSCHVASLVEL